MSKPEKAIIAHLRATGNRPADYFELADCAKEPVAQAITRLLDAGRLELVWDKGKLKRVRLVENDQN